MSKSAMNNNSEDNERNVTILNCLSIKPQSPKESVKVPKNLKIMDSSKLKSIRKLNEPLKLLQGGKETLMTPKNTKKYVVLDTSKLQSLYQTSEPVETSRSKKKPLTVPINLKVPSTTKLQTCDQPNDSLQYSKQASNNPLNNNISGTSKSHSSFDQPNVIKLQTSLEEYKKSKVKYILQEIATQMPTSTTQKLANSTVKSLEPPPLIPLKSVKLVPLSMLNVSHLRGGTAQLMSTSPEILLNPTKETLQKITSDKLSSAITANGDAHNSVQEKVVRNNREKEDQVDLIASSKKPTQKQYICSVCEKEFISGSALINHMKMHAPEKQYICSVCAKECKSSSALKNHIKSHALDKPFSYFKIKNIFSQKRKYKNGKGDIGDNDSTEMESEAEASVDLEPPTHKSMKRLTENDETKLDCLACKKGFQSSTALIAHSKTHLAERRLSPQIRGNLPINTDAESSGTTNKKEHKSKSIHSKSSGAESEDLSADLRALKSFTKRKFVCSVCGEECTSGSALIAHNKTHATKKRFPYSIITKKSSQINKNAESSIKKNKKVHETEIIDNNSSGTEDSVDLKKITKIQFLCSFCGKECKSSSTLILHLKSHTAENSLTHSIIRTLQQNNKRARLSPVLRTNVTKIRRDPDTIQKNGDDNTISNKNSLHSKSETNDLEDCKTSGKNSTVQELQCSVCGKCCTTSSALRLHLKCHIARKPVSHPIIMKNSSQSDKNVTPPPDSSNIKEEAETVQEEMDVDTISDKYSSHSESETNDSDSEDIKISPRNSTKKQFEKDRTTDSTLKTQMQSDTSEKPFSCSICKKAFLSFTSLEIHNMIHATLQSRAPEKVLSEFIKKRTHKCKICNKRFKTPSELDQHEVIHRKPATYCCRYCDKIFKLNIRLKMHIKKFHYGRKPFNCSDCGKKYSSKMALRNHIRMSHSGSKPYPCALCEKGFMESRTFKTHMKRIHVGVAVDPLLL